MILGIDIGGTTTDIIYFKGKQAAGFLSVKADDPVTSASGALGKFINHKQITLQDIEAIAITGVGASALGDNLFGIPVLLTDEFEAIGLGGLYLSGLDKAIVVSMGTGTALVEANGGQQKHLGGTGVGGGTLIGLAKYMIGVSNFDTLLEMAEKGSLQNVDLSIADIAHGEIGNLPVDATASNFGKHNDKANANDLALGIINLVSQTIGMMSIFASRQNGYKKVVLTGKVVKVPQTRKIFENLKTMFDVDFIIPENAEFSTAVGAAYAQVLKKER